MHHAVRNEPHIEAKADGICSQMLRAKRALARCAQIWHPRVLQVNWCRPDPQNVPVRAAFDTRCEGTGFAGHSSEYDLARSTSKLRNITRLCVARLQTSSFIGPLDAACSMVAAVLIRT